MSAVLTPPLPVAPPRSRLLQGNIHFQALGTNFRIWSDGIVSPLFEELESTSRLIAREYDDVEGRRALLNDPQFIADFRRDWHYGRRGRNLAHFRARLGMPDILVVRELERMIFDGAPVPQWEGESMQAVYERLERYQRGYGDSTRSEAERAAFDAFQTHPRRRRVHAAYDARLRQELPFLGGRGQQG